VHIHAAITMRFASTRCRTPWKNWLRVETARNRLTQELPFIATSSHFKRKNTRFRAPASSPTEAPCNIHAAITIGFAASRGKPACIYAHGNTRWQQSCSHSNGICNHRFNKRIELRTLNNHTLQNTKGEPIRRWNERSGTRRTHEVPFIAGRRHFTRKNTQFRAPASSTKQTPSLTPLFVRFFSVKYCYLMYCFVKKSLTPLHPSFPSFVWCIVVWCKVSHHPSLMYCYVMYCYVMCCYVM